MNELGNTPADKNYKPSGIISEEYPEKVKVAYLQGYEQAEKDIITLIESRISEIVGDAQPKPILRAELEELIKRIIK